MDGSKVVTIRVYPVCGVNLHQLDRTVAGVYYREVSESLTDEQKIDEALDSFHGAVPIKVLDDFDIDASVGVGP